MKYLQAARQLFGVTTHLFTKNRARAATTISAFPFNNNAAEGYIKAFSQTDIPLRGPYPGFGAITEIGTLSPLPTCPSNNNLEYTAQQINWRFVLPEGTRVTIADKEGVRENYQGKALPERTLEGPAFADLSIKPGSHYRLSVEGRPVHKRKYVSVPETLPGMNVDQQDITSQSYLEQVVSNYPLRMGKGVENDATVGNFVFALAGFVRNLHRQAIGEGKTIGIDPNNPLQMFDTVRTLTNLRLEGVKFQVDTFVNEIFPRCNTLALQQATCAAINTALKGHLERDILPQDFNNTQELQHILYVAINTAYRGQENKLAAFLTQLQGKLEVDNYVKTYEPPILNETAHYVMDFGLTQPHAQKEVDNAMHIHPGKRIEEHSTSPGTVGVIMSWNPIEDADGKPLVNTQIPDPLHPGKILYFYIIPESSSEALYLPQGTPHKFKACLTPEVHAFCNDAHPTLVEKGLIPQESIEPTHDVVTFLQANPKLEIPELDRAFSKHGGKKMQETIQQAGCYIINTLHPEERLEIAAEGNISGVRSSDIGSSIHAQTVYLEKHFKISEDTIHSLFRYENDRSKTSEIARFQEGVRVDYQRSTGQTVAPLSMVNSAQKESIKPSVGHTLI